MANKYCFENINFWSEERLWQSLVHLVHENGVWMTNVCQWGKTFVLQRFRKNIQRFSVPVRLFFTHFSTYFFRPSQFSRRNPTAGAGTPPRKSRGSEGVGWKMSGKQSNWYWKPLYVFSKPLYDEGFPPLANLRHSNPILMDWTLAASSPVTPPRHRPPASLFGNGQLCSVIIEPWEWLPSSSSYDSYHQIRAECGS